MAVTFENGKKDKILSMFGRFIISWNHVEFSARELLTYMVGDSSASTIVVQQIGNVTLVDALNVAASFHPHAKPHIARFTDVMDRIRPFRNYYVHNIIGTGIENNTKNEIGIVTYLNVRGKIELYEKALRVEDLMSLTEACQSNGEYGNTILEIMKDDDFSSSVKRFSLLDKPPLPEKLKKIPRSHQELQPQPQS